MQSRRELIAVLIAMAAAPAVPHRAGAQGAKPKIGFIGSGKVGSALARLWVAAGYQVMLSGLDIEAVKILAAQIGPNARAGTPAEAAAFGEVVVVTIPYSALPQVGRDYAAQLKGKVVLDTCNFNLQRDGEMARLASEKGAGIADQLLLPGTRLVRAFNTVYAAQLVRTQGEPPGVPVAADDPDALKLVVQLVRDAGFDPVVTGGLATAKSFDDYKSVQGTAREIRPKLGLK